MATRTDMFVRWPLLPRIIEVEFPNIDPDLTVQDLVDTTRILEQEFIGMTHPHLINASGKESLGGGVFVGITAELQNAQLLFESDPLPTATGSVTTGSSAPVRQAILLIDSAATFISDGIGRGFLVFNVTDRSVTSVIDVLSETVLLCGIPSAGTFDDFRIGDLYSLTPTLRHNVSGGNLVAVDSAGSPIDSLVTSAITFLTVEKASGSTLVESAVDLQDLVPAVYIDTLNGTSGTAEGVGLPTNPSDNIVDATAIAMRDNLREFRFRGPLVLDRDFPDWTFLGISSIPNDELDLDGWDISSTLIRGAKLSGMTSGQKMQFENCEIDGVTGLSGTFIDCGVRGVLTGRMNGESTFKECYSLVAGTATPSYVMSTNELLNLRNYSGGWELRSSAAGNRCSLEIDPGQIVLPASNTGGVIVVRGVGTITDNSAGATVNTDGFINSVGLADIIANGVDLKSIRGSELAAILLSLAAQTMARGTITVVNSPTSIEVVWDDGFDPEAGDGIAGRSILFTSGTNIRGGARIAAMDGQGAGDPLLTLTYSTETPPTPVVSDTVILV